MSYKYKFIGGSTNTVWLGEKQYVLVPGKDDVIELEVELSDEQLERIACLERVGGKKKKTKTDNEVNE